MIRSLHITLALAFLLWQPVEVFANDWALLKAEDGIEVYLRESPSSSQKEVRASVLIPGSKPGAVLDLIRNAGRCPEWVMYCKSGRILRTYSPSEWIVYSVTALPFPLKARDTILSTRTQTLSNNMIELTFRTVPDFLPDDPSYVRIRDLSGVWRIAADERDREAQNVRVIYQFTADPGGLFPDWFVNRSLIHQPYETLSNMRRLLAGKG